MKKFLALVITIIMVVSILPMNIFATSSLDDDVAMELIIEFTSHEALLGFKEHNGGAELGGNMLLIDSEYGKISYYKGLPDVVSVTPNGALYQSGIYDSAPNDSGYTSQSSVFTSTRLQEAWQAIEDYAAENSITPSTVKIAVLDTGIDGTHEDLIGRIIDGYDAVNGVPLAGDENTDISAVNHGTKVAGIIAASAYNEKGIAGVAGCFPVSIMPVRVLNEEGRGDIADVVKGIYWAIENGADIINLSFAAPLNYYPYALGKATAAAHDAGILVLAAAGNYGDTVSDYYPASCEGVFPVMSVEKGSRYYGHTDWSNVETHMYRYAEGQAFSTLPTMYTTTAGNGYTSFTGTSASTAYITGYAAMLYSVYGTGENRSVDAVVRMLSECMVSSSYYDEYHFDASMTTVYSLEKNSFSLSCDLDYEIVDGGETMRLTLTIPDNVTARRTKGVIFGTFSYSVGQFGKLVPGDVEGQKTYVYEMDISTFSGDEYADFYAICVFEDLFDAEMSDEDAYSIIESEIWDTPPADRTMPYGGCSYPKTPDTGDTDEEPQYDFTIPGTTVTFLDRFGDTMSSTNFNNLYSSEAYYEWYIYMLRDERGILNLGYSQEGKVFIPHRVYENESEKLLYVAGNNLFLVEIGKDESYVFDGSELLNTFVLKASSDFVTLANAAVYADTPDGFKRIGTTDKNGNLNVNATEGEFIIWVCDNISGYMIRKEISVTDGITEIDLSSDIENAVEIDIKAREDLSVSDKGYVLLINDNTSYSNGELASGMRTREQTVMVSPGQYDIAVAMFYKNGSESYDPDGFYGVDVLLEENATVDADTSYDFDITAFDFELSLKRPSKVYTPEDYEIRYTFIGRDANGYVIRGLCEPAIRISTPGVDMEYTGNTETELYRYAKYDIGLDGVFYIYLAGNDTGYHDFEFNGIDISMFGETELTHKIRFIPDERMADYYPKLFDGTEYYETEIKTAAVKTDSGKTNVFEIKDGTIDYDYSDSIYYIDGDGVEWCLEYIGLDNGNRQWSIPADMPEGTVLMIYDCKGWDGFDINFVEYSDTLLDSPYEFKPSTESGFFAAMTDDGESTEAVDDVEFFVSYGGVTFSLPTLYYQSYGFTPENYELYPEDYSFKFPAGEYTYIFSRQEVDEETYNIISEAIIVDTFEIGNGLKYVTHDLTSLKKFTLNIKYPAFSYINDNNRLNLYYDSIGVVLGLDWPVNEYFDGSDSVSRDIYCNVLPDRMDGEYYYYHLDETVRFSPRIVYKEQKVVENGEYSFDFTPKNVELLSDAAIEGGDNALLQIKITDGCGSEITELWNWMNYSIHTPQGERPYPFEGNHDEIPDTYIHHRYPVTLYIREVGETEYQVYYTDNFEFFDISGLPAGEYEGYVELNLDTYSDEYMVEYPEEDAVYFNVNYIFHGVFRDEFTLGITEHQHDWSDWTDNGDRTHSRECLDDDCDEKETDEHTMGKWSSADESEHIRTCTECDYEETADHSFGTVYTKHDGEQHYRECDAEDCDEIIYEDHTFGEWEKRDGYTGIVRFCTADGCDAYETHTHAYGNWTPEQNNATKHYRECDCGFDKESGNCEFDEGVVTDEASHTEEGTKTYTCTVCGRKKTEAIPKTEGHEYGPWFPDDRDPTKHYRRCSCNEVEKGNCTFDGGVITDEASHTEEGTRTYTCTVCGRKKTEAIPKTTEHEYGDWMPDPTVSDKHYRECACNESRQTADCVFDEGTVTQSPDYGIAGEIRYTCTLCGYEKLSTIPALPTVNEVESENESGEKITVEVPEGSSATIAADTVVQFAPVSDAQLPNVALDNIQVMIGGAKPIATYDINLLLDNVAYQPDGKIKVTLPAIQNIRNFDSVTVFYIAKDGTVKACETTVNEDGTVSFITDHFSTYSVVGVKSGPSMGLILGITIPLCLIALLGGFAYYWFMIKKKTLMDLKRVFTKK